MQAHPPLHMLALISIHIECAFRGLALHHAIFDHIAYNVLCALVTMSAALTTTQVNYYDKNRSTRIVRYTFNSGSQTSTGEKLIYKFSQPEEVRRRL
jgi:hypothetical protein